jgi:hypothetical protein
MKITLPDYVKQLEKFLKYEKSSDDVFLTKLEHSDNKNKTEDELNYLKLGIGGNFSIYLYGEDNLYNLINEEIKKGLIFGDIWIEDDECIEKYSTSKAYIPKNFKERIQIQTTPKEYVEETVFSDEIMKLDDLFPKVEIVFPGGADITIQQIYPDFDEPYKRRINVAENVILLSEYVIKNKIPLHIPILKSYHLRNGIISVIHNPQNQTISFLPSKYKDPFYSLQNKL